MSPLSAGPAAAVPADFISVIGLLLGIPSRLEAKIAPNGSSGSGQREIAWATPGSGLKPADAMELGGTLKPGESLKPAHTFKPGDVLTKAKARPEKTSDEKTQAVAAAAITADLAVPGLRFGMPQALQGATNSDKAAPAANAGAQTHPAAVPLMNADPLQPLVPVPNAGATASPNDLALRLSLRIASLNEEPAVSNTTPSAGEAQPAEAGPIAPVGWTAALVPQPRAIVPKSQPPGIAPDSTAIEGRRTLVAGPTDDPSAETGVKPVTSPTNVEGRSDGLADADRHAGARSETTPATTKPLEAPSAPPFPQQQTLLAPVPRSALDQSGPAPRQPAAEATQVARIQAPEQPAAPASAPVREIAVRVPDNSNGKVDVHIIERGGRVQIDVRTPNPELTQALRSRVDDLVSRLHEQGFRSQSWAPGGVPGAAALDNAGQQLMQDSPGGRADSDPGGGRNGQDSRSKNQHENHRPPPAESFDDSFSSAQTAIGGF